MLVVSDEGIDVAHMASKTKYILFPPLQHYIPHVTPHIDMSGKDILAGVTHLIFLCLMMVEHTSPP